MRKNVVKKVTAATLAFGSLISAFADLGITGGTSTYGDANASASANPSSNPSANPSATPTAPAYETELDCPGWWQAHTLGYAVEEGKPVYITFKSKTYDTAIENWNTPNYVAFTSDDGKVNGPNYEEYVVTRSDNYAWAPGEAVNTGAGLANWTAAGYTISATGLPADWATWLAANKAGVDCALAATRTGNTLTVKFSNNGLVTTVTMPVKADKVAYVSLSGEFCKLTDIKTVTENPIKGDEPTTSPTTSPTTQPTTRPTTNPTTSPTKTPSVNKPVAPKTLTVKETAGYDKATSYTLVKGKKVTITTSISPAKASQKIKATVNKKKVATAKVKGSKVTITAKAVGTAKVTIASTAKASVKKVVTVKVVKKAVAAKKVTVKKATLTIKKGKTGQINIKKITPANTTDKVTYKVTKKLKGVSVDKFGKVTVTKKAKKGSATVTVKVGKKASKKVTIKVK